MSLIQKIASKLQHKKIRVTKITDNKKCEFSLETNTTIQITKVPNMSNVYQFNYPNQAHNNHYIKHLIQKGLINKPHRLDLPGGNSSTLFEESLDNVMSEILRYRSTLIQTNTRQTLKETLQYQTNMQNKTRQNPPLPIQKTNHYKEHERRVKHDERSN